MLEKTTFLCTGASFLRFLDAAPEGLDGLSVESATLDEHR